jgi:hypothetical protein
VNGRAGGDESAVGREGEVENVGRVRTSEERVNGFPVRPETGIGRSVRVEPGERDAFRKTDRAGGQNFAVRLNFYRPDAGRLPGEIGAGDPVLVKARIERAVGVVPDD